MLIPYHTVFKFANIA